MSDNPHLLFPFTVAHDPAYGGAGRKVLAAEQDTEKHVLSCVNVIVRCPVGFRIERPGYGVPWLEYQTEVDEESLQAALLELEPRIGLSTRTWRDWLDDANAVIDIEIEVDSG
jgi:phage baseplate assembly protein W